METKSEEVFESGIGNQITLQHITGSLISGETYNHLVVVLSSPGCHPEESSHAIYFYFKTAEQVDEVITKLNELKNNVFGTKDTVNIY